MYFCLIYCQDAFADAPTAVSEKLEKIVVQVFMCWTRAQLLLRWLHDVAQVECSLLSGGRTRMRLVLLLLLLLLHDLYSANFEDRVRGAGLCVSNSNIPPLHRFRQTTDYWSNFPCQQEIFLFNALFWGGG